jgi:hypothetical protein
VAPVPDRLRADEAQALVSSALGIGVEPALAKATDVLGSDGLAAAPPSVQMTTLTPRQRRGAREADLDLEDLRSRGAQLAGIDAPELRRLRRVTWGSVLQLVLLVVAFLALAANFSGLDLAHLGAQLSHASLWVVALGFILAQAPPLSEAVALLGASPTPVPLKPLFVLQLGMAYISLAAPSTAARVALNIRFFQRHGLAAGTAIAIGALDAITGIIVQAVLVVGLLVLTGGSLDVSFTYDAPGNIGLLAIVAGSWRCSRSRWSYRWLAGDARSSTGREYSRPTRSASREAWDPGDGSACCSVARS